MSTSTKERELTANEALQSLLANDKTKNLPELKVIEGGLKNNIISLGTDEAFALRDNEGEIRAFRQSITLSQKEGTLVQPVPGGPFVVSAQGYEVWAEAAGANVIFPDQVLVGNEWKHNPHAIYGDNGRIKLVHARAVAFRFSSKGIPQVTDWSTVFDASSYRMIDLIAKAKKFPQAFKLLPDGIEPDENGTWGKYIFDEAMTLWVNSAHEEALQWYGQIINREKKAMDFAQTFARRNALKHLSGLQKAPGPVWTLPVVCWRPTSGNIVKWDATQYVQLQKRVGRLVHAQDEFATKQIEAHTGHDHFGDDDQDYAVIDTEMDPEDQQAEASVTGESDQAPKPADPHSKKDDRWNEPAHDDYTDEDHQALQSLCVLQDKADFKPYYEKACENIGIVPHTLHGPNAARALLKEIKKVSNDQ